MWDLSLQHRCLLVHRQRDLTGGEVWPKGCVEKQASGFHHSRSLQQLTVKAMFGSHSRNAIDEYLQCSHFKICCL